MEEKYHQQCSQGSYEGLSDIFNCYICMAELKDACMCPKCQQISCRHCIRRWIRQPLRSHCPHCRAHLTEDDLISVPSVEEIRDVIKMTSRRISRANSNSQAKDICRQHNEQLTVYCNTCDICICASCALWGKHRQEDHDIKPLDELHRKHKDVFTTELKKLKTRMSEIISLVEQVDVKIEKVKTEKGKTKQEIEATLVNIDTRLDDQMKLKLQKLIEAKRRLKQEVQEISSLSVELETRLKGPKSEFIQQEKVLRERMMAKIQKLQESQCNDWERVLEIGNFVNEVVPQGEESTFEIKNFKEKQRNGAEIFSPLLSFSGLLWRLKVYPNGHGDFTGRYLCAFIELYQGYSQPATYHYSVELVRMSGRGSNKNFKREYSSDFVVGDLWGYKKFYDLSKLESEGYLVHDTLVLKFSINHPTYFDKCRDLMHHVNDLKHKIMLLKHQNNQLRQKCQGIKDVDDDPPPKTQASTSLSLSNSSPAHSSIKSSTGSNTQTSPAHSSSVGMGGVPQTSPAHSSHDRTSSGSMAGPHFSQPLHHFKDSSRQSYHPMTPHATLITPLASSTGSTSTQWTNPPPPPPSHYSSYTQQQFMYPATQEGRGFNPHATPHHNLARRQSLDNKMLRLLEQQKWSFNNFAQSQMDYPTSSYLGHHGFKETPIPEAGGYMRGSKSQLHSGSMPRLNFQDLSQGSREGDEEGETAQLGIGDYNADLDPHSTPGVMGGGGSQMGSMVHPGLASQEYFDHAPHMPFLPDMYQMSQPDLLLYHQRCAYPPSSSRSGVKQQATPNQMSKMEKHMSLTDVSSLVDSSPAHSRSIATLHEGAESSWGGGLRPMKPYQRSQGTIPVTDLPPNPHGPPGLASTLSARLASPITQSPSPSRPTSGRRISQHSRQPRHPRPLSGVGPVQVVQSEGGRERRGQQQQRKEMEQQPRGREEERRGERGGERKTDGVSESPPLASVSLSQSPPESVTSQLTQSDSSHQHQPSSKLRSSRRYTQKIKTNNGSGTSDPHTPTLSLTLTDQSPSMKETGGQQRQEQETTSTGGGFSRISVGQRTSSNTSLAAEII